MVSCVLVRSAIRGSAFIRGFHCRVVGIELGFADEAITVAVDAGKTFGLAVVCCSELGAGNASIVVGIDLRERVTCVFGATHRSMVLHPALVMGVRWKQTGESK